MLWLIAPWSERRRARWRLSLAGLVLVALVGGCVKPQAASPTKRPKPAAVSKADAGRGGVDAPVTVMPGESGCPAGTHVCGSFCVDNMSLEHCGLACEPCPLVGGGGTPTCDGTGCGAVCPPDKTPCHGECIASTETCSGECAPGKHDCNGLCVDDTSVNACGAGSCSPCPAPPPGASVSCNGEACEFACPVGKLCGDHCGECCADEDCEVQPGQTAACDVTTNKCTVNCAEGNKGCNGACIPEASCCTDNDCPMKDGQVGKCDTGAGACLYMCTTTTKPCNGACIDSMAACCRDMDCPPQPGKKPTCTPEHACTYACNAGTTDCNGLCIPTTMGSCCTDTDCMPPVGMTGGCDVTAHQCRFVCAPGYTDCGNGKCVLVSAGGCCTDADCGLCKKCSANSCVNQAAGEDVKMDCPSSDCHTGSCNGRGACGLDPDGQQGHGCTGVCQVCQGGSCGGKSGGVCSPKSCAPGNRAVQEGHCLSGSCQQEPVQTCGQFAECQGTTCVTTCENGKPCGDSDQCHTGRFNCATNNCDQQPKRDGTRCTVPYGDKTAIGECRGGTCTNCGNFHDEDCCQMGDPCPGPDYPDGLECVKSGGIRSCINNCGEPGKRCCKHEMVQCSDLGPCPANGKCPKTPRPDPTTTPPPAMP